MIPRKEIRELADLQLDGKQECAVSFYFQPPMPQNKSHQREGIVAKDVIRKIEREIAHHRKNAHAMWDLQRILKTVEDWQGNHGKAVFACRSRNFWREFDLPANGPVSDLRTGHQFHLKPLVTMVGIEPKSRVVIIDRKSARFFDLNGRGIHEREGLFRPLVRRGRSDGWHGYDGGHSERAANDEVLHHFRDVAANLKKEIEQGLWEKWVVGCLETNWHNFEAQLHPDVKARFVGRFQFVLDMTEDKIRSSVSAILRSGRQQYSKDLVKRVLTHARSHKRGVTGLRRVLRSLEMGEVQALLIAENYSAHGVQCTSCGRLDAHLVRYCALCGHSTRKLEDIVDAMMPIVIRRDIELVSVSDQELESVGNIAALLRFRSASRNSHLAEAS